MGKIPWDVLWTSLQMFLRTLQCIPHHILPCHICIYIWLHLSCGWCFGLLEQPIYDHFNITGHNIILENFSIEGREDQNLSRWIKEALFIRVNNPALNKNIPVGEKTEIWGGMFVWSPSVCGFAKPPLCVQSTWGFEKFPLKGALWSTPMSLGKKTEMCVRVCIRSPSVCTKLLATSWGPWRLYVHVHTHIRTF